MARIPKDTYFNYPTTANAGYTVPMWSVQPAARMLIFKNSAV